jgi:hypothetical protein
VAGLASDLAGIHVVAEHGVAAIVAGPIRHEAGLAAPRCAEPSRRSAASTTDGRRAKTRRHHPAAMTCARLQNRRRGGAPRAGPEINFN